MITNKEKELLVRGILTNSKNNNIYSWKTEPEPEIVDLFLKFAKENPAFLVKALLIYEKHGVIENLKYCALAALAFSGDKESFKRAFRKTITTLGDIYNFSILLDSNDSDNYGFRLDSIAKDLLRKKLEKITELDLLPYFVLKRNREKIEFSELRKLLNPTFTNPFLKKAIRIIFGKEPKKNIVKNELPMMWGLLQIRSEKEPETILKLIKEFNIPFKWALATADLRNFNILEPLLARVTATDLVDLLDVFFNSRYFTRSFGWDLDSTFDFGLTANESPSSGAHIMHKILSGLSQEANIDLIYKLYISLINRPLRQRNIYAKIFRFRHFRYGVKPLKELANKKVAIFVDHSSSTFHSEVYVTPSKSYLFDTGVRTYIDTYMDCFERRFEEKKCHLMYYMDKMIIEDYQFPPVLDKRQAIINKFNSPLAPFHYLLKTKSKYDIIMIFTDYDYSCESNELWEQYRAQVHPRSILFLVQMKPFHSSPLKLSDGYFRIFQWSDKTESLILNTLNYKKIMRNQCQ